MKTPPTIDITILQRDLEQVYGITVHTLTFLPRGECSWGYRIETSSGDRFFLKLFRGDPLPAWAARLVYRLHEECHLEQVSYPLPARSGALIHTLAGYPSALFTFIESQSLFELSARREALDNLGQLLARLHACHALDSFCQRVERFDAWAVQEYRQVLDAARSTIALPGAAGEAQRLLKPLHSRLEQLLADLLQCQQKARARPFTPCICHGDPTPGNVLVAAGAAPHLIDWDDLILAPRERDLVFWEYSDMFSKSEPVSPVLDGYASIAGAFTLDPDIITFYHRQWTVGEIADYGHRLLFENPGEQQGQSDLENLAEELKWFYY